MALDAHKALGYTSPVWNTPRSSLRCFLQVLPETCQNYHFSVSGKLYCLKHTNVRTGPTPSSKLYGKTTQYLQSFIPTAIQARNAQQANKHNMLWLEMGVLGQWGWGQMEECLGANGRQLFEPVDQNLEEREHALLVQCFIK